MSMDSVLEFPADLHAALLFTFKETLQDRGMDLRVYFLPDAKVLVIDRGDLGQSNEVFQLQSCQPVPYIAEDKQEANESIGRSRSFVGIGRSKNKQEKEATESMGRAGLDDSFDQSKGKQLPKIFLSRYSHMIRPMKQPRPNTCFFVASTVAVDVDSRRRFFKAEDEPHKFCWKAAKPAEELLEECQNKGLWHPDDGVYNVSMEQVLEKMKERGFPTDSSDIHLCLKKWEMHYWPKHEYQIPGTGNFTAEQTMQLLSDKHYFMGILFIKSAYFEITAPRHGGGDSFLDSFPGVPRSERDELEENDKNAGYHAVICYGCWDGRCVGMGLGLRILILDNHTDQGPSRWVDFRAFDRFIVLTADPPSSRPPPAATAVLSSPLTTEQNIVQRKKKKEDEHLPKKGDTPKKIK